MKTILSLFLLFSTFNVSIASEIDSLLIQSKKLQNSNPDSAKTLAIKALDKARKSGDLEQIAKSYNQLGIVYYFFSDFVKSKKNILKSLEIFKEIDNESKVATCFNNLGVIYYESGELEKSLHFYSEAIKVLQTDPLAKEMYAMALNNVGNVYKDLDNFENALDFYHKSIEIKYLIDDKYGTAMTLNNIGLVYQNISKYDSAIKFYNKSIRIKNEIDDKHGLAMTLSNLGEAHLAQNEFEKAYQEFEKALKMKQEISDRIGVCITLIDLSEINYQLKRYDKAIKVALESITISKEIGSLKNEKDGYSILSNIYEDMGRYKEALETYKEFEELEQKIFSENSMKQLAVLEADLEKYQSKKEIEKLKNENKTSKNILGIVNKQNSTQKNIIIVITILLFTMLFIVFFLLKRVKRHKIVNQNLFSKSEVANEALNGVIIYDKDFNINWMNNSAEKMFGTKLVDSKGIKLSKLIKIKESEYDFINLVLNLRNDKKVSNKIKCIINSDANKSEKTYLFNTSPIVNNKKLADCFIEIITDIS